MGDSIIINSLEKLASGDTNNLQAMATRQLASFFNYFGAFRLLGTSAAVPGFDTIPRNWTIGLDVHPNAVGDSLIIMPGLLSQFNLTYPAAPGALEDAQRIGFNRSAHTIAHPGAASMTYLLEARVVDTVTATDTRDILNVVTGNFDPTVVNKQTERQIEFQFTAGSATVFPAFNGTSWVPICMFITDGSGLWNGALGSSNPPFVDCRNDIRDLFFDVPAINTSELTLEESLGDSYIENYSLSSDPTDDRSFHANFYGRSQYYRAWIRALGSLNTPTAMTVLQSGYTPAADALEHLWLLPLKANSQECMPTVIYPVGARYTGTSSKGVMVAGDAEPAPGGPWNLSTIDFVAGSYWANFDPVVAGRALHVATYWLQDSDGLPWLFTQNSGGLYRSFTQNVVMLGNLVQSDSRTTTVDGAVTIDFRDVAPQDARTLLIEMYATNSSGSNALIYPMKFGGTSPDDLWSVGMLVEAGAAGEVVRPFEIPCKFDTYTDIDLRFDVYCDITTPGAGTINVFCALVGWTY